MTLPTGLLGGETGHVSWHNNLHDKYNLGDDIPVYNVKHYGALGDGVADDSAARAAAISAAPAGSIVYFPAGLYRTDPFTLTKQLTLMGEGRFNTWLTPTGATSSPLVTVDVQNTAGTNRTVYGAAVRDLGLDLRPASGSTGIRTTSNTHWFLGEQLYIEGGSVALDIRGPNGWFEEIVMTDAVKFVTIDESGLEVVFSNIRTSTNSITVTTTRVMECIAATSGGKGAIYIDGWQHNSRLAGTTGGFKVTCPTSISLPIFARGVILDNGSCADGYLELVNVIDVVFTDGWINNAVAGGAGCVKITGGGNLKFANNDYFGSPTTQRTYHLLGTINGFTSKGNYCPTGPVVFFDAAAAVTDLHFDDRCPGATALSQITNDADKWVAATAKFWGPRDFPTPGGTTIAQEEVHFVGGAGEPAFQNSWANHSGHQAAYFWKDSQGVVHLAGTVTGGSAATIFTLPVGYRSAATETFFCSDTAGGGDLVNVNGDGTVATLQVTSPIGLSGITFRAGG